MNLHLLWDEKITSRIVKTFEFAIPGKNIYLCWRDKGLNNKSIIKEYIYIYESNQNQIQNTIDFKKVTKVLIHGLDINKIRFCINYLDNSIPIYWLLWGAELYNVLLFPKGYKLYYKSHPPYSIKEVVKQLFNRIGYLGNTEQEILKFLQSHRVTMMSSVEDYSLLCKYYPSVTKNILNAPGYFYYPVDEILSDDLINSSVKGNMILIGNSCSWTNNHEYVFDKIKKFDISDKVIVTPLSYGGNKEYQDKILKLGRKLFGSSYKPLKEFLPLSEYNQILARAEICIYGNWRQEAFGNILISLYLGAKVFISNKSSMLSILKNKGLSVYCLEDMTQKDIHSPLNEDIKNRNRQIILNYYNYENLIKETQNRFN